MSNAKGVPTSPSANTTTSNGKNEPDMNAPLAEKRAKNTIKMQREICKECHDKESNRLGVHLFLVRFQLSAQYALSMTKGKKNSDLTARIPLIFWFKKRAIASPIAGEVRKSKSQMMLFLTETQNTSSSNNSI